MRAFLRRHWYIVAAGALNLGIFAWTGWWGNAGAALLAVVGLGLIWAYERRARRCAQDRLQSSAEDVFWALQELAARHGDPIAMGAMALFVATPRERWGELRGPIAEIGVRLMHELRDGIVGEDAPNTTAPETTPTGEQYEGEPVDLSRCVRCGTKIDPADLLGLCDGCSGSLRDGIAGGRA